jgi:PAS domain S-box-containing protein
LRPTRGSGRLPWLSALGIRGRLLLGFIAVALFTGGLGAYAIGAMAVVNENQDIMYTDEFGGLYLFTQYIELTSRSRIEGLAYLLATSPVQRASIRDQVAAGEADIDALAAQIDASDIDQGDAATLEIMTDAWHAYARWRENVLFGPFSDDAAEMTRAYYTDGAGLVAAFESAAEAFRAQRRSAAAELAASASAAYEQTRRFAIALSLGAVIMALGVGVWVSQSILRPVRQVGSAAGKLAVGELDQQLALRSHDELGQMADAFRGMVAYQKEMATVATAIAAGDLSMDIEPKSPADVLGTAFQQMSRNLRAMVGELEGQAVRLGAQAQMLDLANDAIIVREPATGVIRFWSRGAEEMYGWSKVEAIGQVNHILLKTELLHREDSPAEFLQSAEAGYAALTHLGRWSGELIHNHKDGTRITVACRQAVVRDDSSRATAVIAINTDVTQRFEAEAALARARDAAEAASRAKTDFLANTSHEIRTPMNAILGMAELLAETPLNEEQREYVRTFQRAGDTLLALINDVLDLSKVEAGQLELERVAFYLDELVEHIADVLAVRAHAKGLELFVHVLPDVPTRVTGDPPRLRQVLVNLLGNAIKFTDVGEVGLRVELDPEGTDTATVRFSVSDTGIGVPADKQDEIFASFVQADASTTRRHGGTGLGLSISSRIVELMGGRIRVRSQLGKGSTFSFSIPLEAPPGAGARPPGPSLDIQGWRVLVADDNATNRLILRQFLTAFGATVFEAKDGLEAVSAIQAARDRRQAFRLLLLDGRMPGLDGFDVATRLRDISHVLNETVVMITSDSRAGDVARARELGLAAYLVKPIKRAELIRTIASVITTAPPPGVLAEPPTTPVQTEILAAERSAPGAAGGRFGRQPDVDPGLPQEAALSGRHRGGWNDWLHEGARAYVRRGAHGHAHAGHGWPRSHAGHTRVGAL